MDDVTIEAAPADAERCPSCDHLTDDHAEEGCWYTVTTGRPAFNLVCPCTLPGGRQ